MKEIWKDIKDYEGLYQVSNLGRVKHLEFTRLNPLTGGISIIKEKILKQNLTSFGYLSVALYKNEKKKWYFVHRLVANAFIPNPDDLPIINHKDENKVNNCADNLEWCDYLYNNLYNNKHKKSWVKVKQLDKNNNIINIFESITEASKKTNIIQCEISNCLHNRQKTAGGYYWQYYKEEKKDEEDK